MGKKSGKKSKAFFSKETLTPGTDTRAADKRQRG